MATVTVRYIVNDGDESISFYRDSLGFEEVMHPAPTFAMLSRGDLRLALSAPSGQGGGARRCRTARSHSRGLEPVLLQVEDLEQLVDDLRSRGVSFRNEIVTGNGGKQTLVEDPSGNPVELFEPLIDEAREQPPIPLSRIECALWRAFDARKRHSNSSTTSR